MPGHVIEHERRDEMIAGGRTPAVGAMTSALPAGTDGASSNSGRIGRRIEIGYLLATRRLIFSLLALSAVLIASLVAQETAQVPIDETIAPGNNYDKADFRLYVP